MADSPKCPKCSRTFTDDAQRDRHLVKVHGVKDPAAGRRNKKIALGVVIILGVSGAVAVAQNYTPPYEGGWNLDGEPMLGSEDATVQFVMFEDPNCPFCKRFHDQVYPRLKADYVDSGRVAIYFKQFAGGNPWTHEGNIAHECAFVQGNEYHWAFTERFYTFQSQIGRSNLRATVVSWAEDLDMDVAAFRTCYDERETAEEVGNDLTDGRALGARGTPNFFVRVPGKGSEMITGAQDYAVFASALDQALRGTGG